MRILTPIAVAISLLYIFVLITGYTYHPEKCRKHGYPDHFVTHDLVEYCSKTVDSVTISIPIKNLK